jgi:hypothetical protein
MQRLKKHGYWTGADTAAEGVVLLTGVLGALAALAVLKLTWPRPDHRQQHHTLAPAGARLISRFDQ